MSLPYESPLAIKGTNHLSRALWEIMRPLVKPIKDAQNPHIPIRVASFNQTQGVYGISFRKRELDFVAVSGNPGSGMSVAGMYEATLERKKFEYDLLPVDLKGIYDSALHVLLKKIYSANQAKYLFTDEARTLPNRVGIGNFTRAIIDHLEAESEFSVMFRTHYWEIRHEGTSRKWYPVAPAMPTGNNNVGRLRAPVAA